MLAAPQVSLSCSQVKSHWPAAWETTRRGCCSREPSRWLDSVTQGSLPACTVCDCMIRQFCFQKPFPQGHWVSGTDRWRRKDLGNIALLRWMGRESQGCIPSPPATFLLAQTQPADKFRGGKGQSADPGGHCQSWVLLAAGTVTRDRSTPLRACGALKPSDWPHR